MIWWELTWASEVSELGEVLENSLPYSTVGHQAPSTTTVWQWQPDVVRRGYYYLLLTRAESGRVAPPFFTMDNRCAPANGQTKENRAEFHRHHRHSCNYCTANMDGRRSDCVRAPRSFRFVDNGLRTHGEVTLDQGNVRGGQWVGRGRVTCCDAARNDQ